MPNSRYEGQRNRVIPPHVSLSDLRRVAGLTIDEVIRRVPVPEGQRPYTRGAISAVENGHRGASDELLRALEVAYRLRPGALTTSYRPRAAKSVAA